MKAVVLSGIKDALRYQEVALPEPSHGEVRVMLKAAAFNRRDYWIQQGQYAELVFPIILGSDGCGYIDKVVEGGNESLIGQPVLINPSIEWGNNESVQGKSYRILGLPDNGTFAEYVCVPEKNIYPKPAHLTYAQAASLPLAGLTAYRALFSRAKLKSGERVLITGIGGGVACFALQFAAAIGAEVYVTSGSEEKIVRAKELGAQGGISYKAEGWGKSLVKEAGYFDVIIDGAGGLGFLTLIDIAAPGGRIVFYGGTQGLIPNISPQKIFWKQLSLLGSTMGSDTDFQNMLTFVETHQIIPNIDSVFALSEAEAAMQLMVSSSQIGKIVLSI